MITTIPFSERLSEHWLLERTYHAQLRDGRELSVADLTLAMTQLIDFFVPLSLLSAKSKLPERVPLKKSSNFSVPISTWCEISQEEAQALYHQGFPILLYGEHTWEHPQGAHETWRPNRNMRILIYGDESIQPEVTSGIEYALCYLDTKRGAFSNGAWRAWFPSDTTTVLDGVADSSITFLTPSVLFPYTTHYTVIAADGHIQEYADRAEAIQGFLVLPPREVSKRSSLPTVVFPQFCYYHEVTCPDGVYRLEFFGPRMDEQGYRVKEAGDH
jgi:hypothetical protein